MVTFPGSAKRHFWTTGHLGEASMTLLSSRRKEAAGVAKWGVIGVRTLHILSREAEVEARVLAAVLRLIGYTGLLPGLRD